MKRMNNVKNAIAAKIMGSIVIGMTVVAGVTPITVFAQDKEAECICEEKCTQDSINEECAVCLYDYNVCEGAEPHVEGDEECTEAAEENYGPLTPDGNMNLIDDYGSIEAGGKQFITVTTKSGNYFYIIIDRDDNGTETVHFLNMVDEADLLALMDEDAVNEYIAAKDAKNTEPAVTETPEPTEEPAEPEDTKAEEPKKNSSGALIIVLILALGGAGGYLYFTKFKGKKPQKETVDPDADYTEEDDDYLDNLADEVDEIMTEDEETEDSRLIKFDESDSDADDSGDEE